MTLGLPSNPDGDLPGPRSEAEVPSSSRIVFKGFYDSVIYDLSQNDKQEFMVSTSWFQVFRFVIGRSLLQGSRPGVF